MSLVVYVGGGGDGDGFCFFYSGPSFSSCSPWEHFSATSFFPITGKKIRNTAVFLLKCHLLPKLQNTEPPGEDAS